MKICRHFAECGGCSFQDIPYEIQRENKKKLLKEIFPEKDIEIIPSERISGFRNKMEYTFESESLGLHQKGKYDKVVDLLECPVFSEEAGELLNKFRKFSKKYSIPFYSRREKKGALRHLVIRESKFTGQKLIIVAVDAREFTYKDELKEFSNRNFDERTSVILARIHRTGDTALTSDYEVISGSGIVEMKIGDLEYTLSPYSFFQPNSFQVKKIYDWIDLNINKKAEIIDLFTGIGTIPIYIYSPGRIITGVENFKSCIKDAELNKEKLKPDADIRFIESSVRTYLSEHEKIETIENLIIDPPRGGMSYRIWKNIERIREKYGNLKKVLYICCNLKLLVNDIAYITENTAWEIKEVKGVDQFVHTPHLETLIEFELK